MMYTYTDNGDGTFTSLLDAEAIKSKPLYPFDISNFGTYGSNQDLVASNMGAAIADLVSIPVFRARDARQRAVAGMGWRIIDNRTDEEICTSNDTNIDNPLAIAIHRQRKKSGHDVFGLWESARCLAGEVYIVKLKNRWGFPADIEWLNPANTMPYAPNGVIQGFRYSGRSGTKPLATKEVVYDRYMNLRDDIRGQSPAEVAMSTINIERNTLRQFGAFFRNNATMGGAITPRANEILDENHIKQIRNQIYDGHRGVDKAFKFFVSPIPIELQKYDMPDVEKNIGMLSELERRIYSAFGVPRPVAGDTDGSRYQASKSDYDWFYWNTILPECSDIASLVNVELVPFFDPSESFRFEFMTEQYDRTTIEKRERAAEDWKNGGITLNEYRDRIGADPLPNGDVFSMPYNINLVPKSRFEKPDQQQPLLPEPEQPPTQSGTPNVENEPDTHEQPQPTQERATQHPTVTETKTYQDSAIAELEAWKKVALKNWQRDFQPYHTRGTLADVLTEAIKVTDGDKSQIVNLFNTAFDVVNTKAIQATQLNFEMDMEDLLIGALSGRVNRSLFTNRLKQLVARAGNAAFRDGLNDGGVQSNPDPDELELIADLIDQQRDYIRKLGDYIYKEKKLTTEDTTNKPLLWWKKSILVFYNEGLTSANRNQMLEFAGTDGAESCWTCQKLKEQRHRAKDWKRVRLRPGIDTYNFECGGWRCQHILVPVQARARGRFPAIKMVEVCDHNHDHNHEEIPISEQDYTLEQYQRYYQTEGYTKFETAH